MRIFFHEKGSQKGQFVPAAAGWCLAHTMVKKVLELPAILFKTRNQDLRSWFYNSRCLFLES